MTKNEANVLFYALSDLASKARVNIEIDSNPCECKNECQCYFVTFKHENLGRFEGYHFTAKNIEDAYIAGEFVYGLFDNVLREKLSNI